MTTSVKELLQSFELLSEDEKRKVASEIILRTTKLNLLPLTDEELIFCAGELFLELDRIEAKNG